MPEIDERSRRRSYVTKCKKLPCLWPAAFSTAWHCAHFVLKIFSPAFSFPLGASAKVAIVVDGRSSHRRRSSTQQDRSNPTMHQFPPEKNHEKMERKRADSVCLKQISTLSAAERSACLFALWCSCALPCTRAVQMVSVVAMEAAGAPRVSRRRAAPPRGAVK